MKLRNIQRTIHTAISIAQRPIIRMSSTASTNTRKGYVFGLATNNQPTIPPVTPPLGRVVANQKISDTVYKENAQAFHSAFVYEFPTLQDAVAWKEGCCEYSQDPMVVSESEVLDPSLSGFSIFFLKIHDKAKFAAYKPSESLSQYSSQRLMVPLTDDAIASNSTKENYDAAVLIAFETAEHGKEWLTSEEYLKPHGELRLATTSGPGVVISGDSDSEE